MPFHYYFYDTVNLLEHLKKQILNILSLLLSRKINKRVFSYMVFFRRPDFYDQSCDVTKIKRPSDTGLHMLQDLKDK